MKSRIWSFFVISCASIILPIRVIGKKSGSRSSQLSKIKKPVHVILDSDIGPDYDDVGAFTLLHAFADKGEAKILATVASNRYPRIGEVIDVLNTYFNRPDIPIGVPKGPSVELKEPRGWAKYIVSHYPHKIKSNRETPDPVEIYRKVLSRQPDHSVTIISIGFFTNLANLLESKPDKYSRLNGIELVREKVKKLVSMAGKYPSGAEFNVDNDIPSANFVFQKWPTTIIFDGFKIGAKIKTGLSLVHNKNIVNDPVKDVFRISLPQSPADSNGHPSWDETAVLAGVRGAAPYFKKIPGHITTVDDYEKVHWNPKTRGQYYLVMNKSASYIGKVINELLEHEPAGE